MPIAYERLVSLGVMGVRAQVAECQSAVLAQAAATLLPSARSYHSFCTPRPGKNTNTRQHKFEKNKKGVERKNTVDILCVPCSRHWNTLKQTERRRSSRIIVLVVL